MLILLLMTSIALGNTDDEEVYPCEPATPDNPGVVHIPKPAPVIDFEGAVINTEKPAEQKEPEIIRPDSIVDPLDINKLFKSLTEKR